MKIGFGHTTHPLMLIVFVICSRYVTWPYLLPYMASKTYEQKLSVFLVQLPEKVFQHTYIHIYAKGQLEIFTISIYHFFCITIQRYIARYSIVCNIAEFCRWIEPFFKTMMFYTYQTVTEIKLAYNYSINHNQLQHQS